MISATNSCGDTYEEWESGLFLTVLYKLVSAWLLRCWAGGRL